MRGRQRLPPSSLGQVKAGQTRPSLPATLTRPHMHGLTTEEQRVTSVAGLAAPWQRSVAHHLALPNTRARLGGAAGSGGEGGREGGRVCVCVVRAIRRQG